MATFINIEQDCRTIRMICHVEPFPTFNNKRWVKMKKLLLSLAILGSIFSLSYTLHAEEPQKTISGIRQDWGATKYLDEIYFLKKGWIIVRINKSGQCEFEAASWDDVDSFGSLYRDILREADLNRDRRVTRAEAARVLAVQKQIACMNRKKRGPF